MNKIQIIRREEAQNSFAVSRANFYKKVASGLYPPSISLGARAVGWIESEVQAVLRAFTLGKSETEIKELVKNLIINRKNYL